jgi:hypothetical protein
MSRSPSGDDDSLHFTRVDERLAGRMDFGARQSGRDPFRFVDVDVTERDHLGADELVRESANVLSTDHAHADHAHPKCHVRFLPFARQFGRRRRAWRGFRFRRLADAILTP